MAVAEELCTLVVDVHIISHIGLHLKIIATIIKHGDGHHKLNEQIILLSEWFFIGYWINTGWISIRPFFIFSNPVVRVFSVHYMQKVSINQ